MVQVPSWYVTEEGSIQLQGIDCTEYQWNGTEPQQEPLLWNDFEHTLSYAHFSVCHLNLPSLLSLVYANIPQSVTILTKAVFPKTTSIPLENQEGIQKNDSHRQQFTLWKRLSLCVIQGVHTWTPQHSLINLSSFCSMILEGLSTPQRVFPGCGRRYLFIRVSSCAVFKHLGALTLMHKHTQKGYIHWNMKTIVQLHAPPRLGDIMHWKHANERWLQP